MKEAIRVHVIDSTDQLEHESTNVLSLQWTMTRSNCFVKISLRAVLQNQISMSISLKVVNKIDKVGMEL